MPQLRAQPSLSDRLLAILKDESSTLHPDLVMLRERIRRAERKRRRLRQAA